MLTCREITELANGYLDHELPLLSWAQVRMHLLMCAHCRRYIDQLADAVNLLKGLPQELPPAEVEEKLIACLRDQGVTRLPE